MLFWLENSASVKPLEVSDALFRIKREIKARDHDVRYPHDHLITYPADPSQLPPPMLEYVFPDGVPEARTFPGLDGFARMVKLRGPSSPKANVELEARVMNDLRTELAPIADVGTYPTVEALLPSTPTLRRSLA